MTTSSDPHINASQESWDEIKARLQKRWGQIGDEELKSPMTMSQLSDLVHERTGEAREKVEQFLAEMQEAVWLKAEALRSAIGPRISSLQEQASGQLHDASGAVRDGMHAVETQVRRKPGQAVSIAFGVGIVAGLLLGSGRRS